ncbi:hypothetical protein ABT061_14285 [Streptosporangium sp. NPDC002544]|uniref:hypothetical protein n=1 Tax=Streptosporangium sp. NPDC002544 TaxID=3154538 RepID=UPI0033233723
MAAAFRGATGQVVGSVSLCGAQDMFIRSRRELLGEWVATAAADISADLGFRTTGRNRGTSGDARPEEHRRNLF